MPQSTFSNMSGRPLAGQTSTQSDRLGDMLVSRRLISLAQLDAALAQQSRQQNTRLGRILLDQGSITFSQLNVVLAEKLGIPRVHLTKMNLTAQTVNILPASIAFKYLALCVRQERNRVWVAMANPFDKQALDDIAFYARMRVEPMIAAEKEIRLQLHRYFSHVDEHDAVDEVRNGLEGRNESLAAVDAETLYSRPVVRLVAGILNQAVLYHASDIHITPLADALMIYYRIDGRLHGQRRLNKSLLPMIVARIKVMGGMDVSERRCPQDGHADIEYNGKRVDLRFSIVPTIHGESIVIRLLSDEVSRRDLKNLGLQEVHAQRLQRLIGAPHGLILVTGPTGSGKTTTLYGLLGEIARSGRHIISVEDPVEYDVEGVEQVQLNQLKGHRFADVLRQFLRHDPDVIMVGEIRDSETAQIAIRAALTGHLVLSTLHTNDALSSVTRLADMGIPDYLLKATLKAVLAQRLLRLNCTKCLEPYHHDELDFIAQQGRGCKACFQTGYKGRVMVNELLEVDGDVVQAVLGGGAHQHPVKIRSMYDNAMELVRNGRTTLEEVRTRCGT